LRSSPVPGEPETFEKFDFYAETLAREIDWP
jgi:hypothetical protein